ncbi:DNA polymerase III subunit delta [Breznakia sp. OttesenSCG-928-G09]|nr:DNA polymerase III subunit delta [Breznakia sp. OttesenSCG-928-G09]
MFQEVLKAEHPQVYTILKNALLNDRLAHAYMFVGDKGAPKKETAYLLAQSLVCDEEGFGCEQCDACLRVQHNNYADMVYLDGSEISIKKEDIIRLKSEFSKTNVEQKGKKIYIIDGAEYATISALNSLLTFLEEPDSQTIAILLVENSDRILDTIKSRCQMITFHKMNKEECFIRIKEEYDILDAYLLSHIGLHQDKLKAMEESEEYQHARYVFKTYMEKYLKHYLDASVFLQKDGFAKSKRDQKLVLHYVLDMMNLLAKDALIHKRIKEAWYDEKLELMDERTAEHILVVANRIKDKNIKSVNLNLLVDQFIYEMEEYDE